jgi:hypothetical protein
VPVAALQLRIGKNHGAALTAIVQVEGDDGNDEFRAILPNRAMNSPQAGRQSCWEARRGVTAEKGVIMASDEPTTDGGPHTVRAPGPLVVSEVNPRSFTVVSDPHTAVYLTGSHIWNNLHDGMGPGRECSEEPEQFDYDAYLDFLEEHGHNFIRLWRWEQFRSQAAGGDFHLCMTPQPWPRTGRGAATDGKPRFDLTQFDDAFFDRLRDRVAAAGTRGIYVGVMLFDGWALHLSPAPDHVEGHPFHAANNVNGIGIESIVDHQVLPLDPGVQEVQEAYIREGRRHRPRPAQRAVGGRQRVFRRRVGRRRVRRCARAGGHSRVGRLDAVAVLGDRRGKRHEEERGYERHPIGMTMQFPVADESKVNDALFASRAEWISPGYHDDVFVGGGHPMASGAPPSRWFDDPPVADGRKVVITDTDHYAPGQGDALWAWKSFLRGHHPILMDFGLIGGVDEPDSTFAAARFAMGDTRRFAERTNLLDMTPRGDLSSTGYALANPGHEYLVLQPMDVSDAFTVVLEPGVYSAEWFSIDTRQTVARHSTTVERAAATSFPAPVEVSGPTVLYLTSRRSGARSRTTG